ncbi:divergent polysaccharide deacetylase family protein [Salidesulfovibrio brasiliensis]|uniref:divergent polysaccharide deacetylase family protein n=1 Tax=Salidesulfovibrio brasiliensis TaxID=221711 RepID=UPI0006D0A677|nr:divergent polysaccharide deacetylase family protein [Salidesulfovibrio brasiliensis]
MTDEHRHDEEPVEQESKGRWSDKLLRPVPMAGIAVGLLLIVLLAVLYQLRRPDPKAAITPPKVTMEQNKAKRPFEEPQPPGVAEQVRLVDFALLEALKLENIDFSKLQLTDVEVRKHNGHDYHYQTMVLPEPEDRATFLAHVREALDRRLSRAMIESNGTEAVVISVDTIPTHRISFPEEPEVLQLGDGAPDGPLLSVVIDDVGENMGLLRRLIALNVPVSFAVWPHSTHTDDSIRLINESGLPLLLHFPMQPKGWPGTNPGEGAVFTNMTADQIRAVVKSNLELVPGAVGANNHMGSAFTEFHTGMKVVLKELHDRHLFFLDSRTTPRSAAKSEARKIGIPFYQRDVFIDNTKDVNAIILQLKKAERIARKTGVAIAIGHPHPETVAALEQWAAKLDGTVNIVPITQLRPDFQQSAKKRNETDGTAGYAQ